MSLLRDDVDAVCALLRDWLSTVVSVVAAEVALDVDLAVSRRETLSERDTRPLSVRL